MLRRRKILQKRYPLIVVLLEKRPMRALAEVTGALNHGRVEEHPAWVPVPFAQIQDG